MASVWFEGVDALNTVTAQLTSKAGRVGAQGAAVVRSSAHRIESLQKQFVSVDTGTTKSSIGTDFTGDGRTGVMESETGPTTNYAPYLEWGTERMAPRAFAGPALDIVAPDYLAAIERISDPFDE